jgi:hypothetical protein
LSQKRQEDGSYRIIIEAEHVEFRPMEAVKPKKAKKAAA